MKWSWWWESRSESLDSYVNSPSANIVSSGVIKSSKGDNLGICVHEQCHHSSRQSCRNRCVVGTSLARYSYHAVYQYPFLRHGNPVDLSHRITEYYYYADGDKTQKVTGHSEKAVLSAEEAARYTVKNVLSGSDGWQPTLLCEACEAPVVKKINATLECLSGCCASCAGCQ